jgi:hypothetical protein
MLMATKKMRVQNMLPIGGFTPSVRYHNDPTPAADTRNTFLGTGALPGQTIRYDELE